MRVITFNANGIRAAARKGFFEWLDKQKADIVCIQETKAQVHQLDDPIFHPKKYHCYYFDALKKGYSGTAVYCREKPKKVTNGLGFSHADTEGRYLQIDYDDLSVASIYVPSGSSSEERQSNKMIFLDDLMYFLKKVKRKRRGFIICGDWNIAHKNEDIKNWKGNKKNSGFTPEERSWLDKLFEGEYFKDAFREIPQDDHQYTWWSNRGRARENNVGWRIDYQILSPRFNGVVKKTSIYKDHWFSDHAPLTIDYEIDR